MHGGNTATETESLQTIASEAGLTDRTIDRSVRLAFPQRVNGNVYGRCEKKGIRR